MKKYGKGSPSYVAIAAITLDGKIARHARQLSGDWTSEEDKKYFQAELKKFDAVLVGRNTFEVAKKHLLKRNTIVLTSGTKTTEEKYPHVWFCNYKKIGVNTFIHSLGFKKIAVIGGSKVYSFALKKKLLSELYLTVEPLIFGKGINLFDDSRFHMANFILVSIKRLNKRGSLLLKYKR